MFGGYKRSSWMVYYRKFRDPLRSSILKIPSVRGPSVLHTRRVFYPVNIVLTTKSIARFGCNVYRRIPDTVNGDIRSRQTLGKQAYLCFCVYVWECVCVFARARKLVSVGVYVFTGNRGPFANLII